MSQEDKKLNEQSGDVRSSDSVSIEPAAHAAGRYTNKDRVRVFAGLALVWLVFDRLSKMYFENSYGIDQVSSLDYLLFRFRLVHNTGAAWGMFGDSTFILGIVSVLVCVAIVVLFVCFEKIFEHPASLVESAALGLVLAGGLGNAIDRFLNGYVVDFIDLTFIDFPVFNIADIGVTCGFAIFIGCIIMSWVREKNTGDVND